MQSLLKMKSNRGKGNHYIFIQKYRSLKYNCCWIFFSKFYRMIVQFGMGETWILMEKWQTCTKVTDFFVYILRLLLLKFIAATSLWKYIRSNFHCFFFLACLSVLTTQCYIWFHYQKKIDFDCLALTRSVL